MWVRASGELSENVIQLTTAVSSHFLLSADSPTLIDSSISAESERLLASLGESLGEEGVLEYLLLTGAEFDAVGGLASLRKVYPDLVVMGSPASAERLNDSEHVSACYQLNLQCAEALGVSLDISEEDFAAALKIDQIIRDGDTLAQDGGLEIKVIGCTGYASDGLAYFIRPDDVLYGGEAVGCYNGRGKIAPTFAGSYQAYLEDIDKLSSLDISALGLAHNGTLTGELAMRYLSDLRDECERFFSQVRERIDAGELVEEISESLVPEFTGMGLAPGGPFVEPLRANVRSMVAAVAGE